MSITRKINDSIVFVGLTENLQDGEIEETESWEGSLEQVREKFEQVKNAWQRAKAQRRGPNVLLTLERTTPAPEDHPHQRGMEETVEVLWREVMLPLRQAPGILTGVADGSLSLGILGQIDYDFAYNPQAFADAHMTSSNAVYKEYATLLSRGVTEFPSAVPVVRRTITRQNRSQNRLGLGTAYVRDEPPVSVPGSWQWLKTTDERRRDGRTYTQVEEWTGGPELSTLIYPET